MNSYQERLPCGRLIWAFRPFSHWPGQLQPTTTATKDRGEKRDIELGALLARCEAINLALATEVLNVSSRQLRRLIAGGKLECATKGKVTSSSIREWIRSGQPRSVAKK